VETVPLARLRKKGAQDPFIIPQLFNVSSSPYSIVLSTFESVALLQIMFYAIFTVLVMTDEWVLLQHIRTT
jgi:E3 ubiquitin-protein ligase UBR1